MPHPRKTIASTLALVASLVATMSCQRGESTAPLSHVHPLPHPTSAASQARSSAGAAYLAGEVRDLTARYVRERKARSDGYVPDPFCVAAPGLGGMGHHWVNPSLVDPVFQANAPEVVLYAPDTNGRLQLVAVEYIVLDVGQPAPTFGGQPFDVGGTPVPVPHWSLHVWVHKTNPSGMFAPFNPDVNCPT